MIINAQVNLKAFNEAIQVMKAGGENSLVESQLRNSLIIKKQPLRIDHEQFERAMMMSYDDDNRRSYIRSDTSEIIMDPTVQVLNDTIAELGGKAELIPIPTFSWDCLHWWDKYTPDSPATIAAWMTANIAGEVDPERDGFNTFNEFIGQTSLWGDEVILEWFEWMKERFPDKTENIEWEWNDELAKFQDYIVNEWVHTLNHRNFDFGFYCIHSGGDRASWYSVRGEYQVVWSFEEDY